MGRRASRRSSSGESDWSAVPPFTPFVMMTRMASVPAPPAWQQWATLALLIVAKNWLDLRPATAPRSAPVAAEGA